MRAKKENKVYVISEHQKDRYLKNGYDIYDEEGRVLEYSPLKKVPYSDYVKLQQEREALRLEVSRVNELCTAMQTELKQLQKELDAAKKAAEKTEKAAKGKKDGG